MEGEPGQGDLLKSTSSHAGPRVVSAGHWQATSNTSAWMAPAPSQERLARLLLFVVGPDCVSESTSRGSCCLQVTQVWRKPRVTVKSL